MTNISRRPEAMTSVKNIFFLSNACAVVLSILDIIFLGINAQGLWLEFWWHEALGNYALHAVCMLPAVFFILNPRAWLSIMGRLWMAVFLCAWLFSWLLFIFTRQLLDIETVRFCAYNFFPLLGHIFQTSAGPFLATVVLAAVCFLSVYRWGKPLLSCLSQRLAVKKSFTVIWLFACVLAGVGLLTSFQNRAAGHRPTPQTAWWSSVLEYMYSQDRTLVRSDLIFRQNKKIPWPDFLAGQKPLLKKTPVIIIVVESLRSDVLKDGRVMPNLFKLKQESLFFPNTFPASDETDYAWPAVLSSQYPLHSAGHHFYPLLITYPHVLIYDVLKQFGYQTAIFSAQNERWGRMRNFLYSPNLDEYFDARSGQEGHYDVSQNDPVFNQWVKALFTVSKIDDARVVQRTMDWIKDLKTDAFFLAINLQRPHFPYTWPDSFIPPFSPFAVNFPATFLEYPRQKTSIMKNRYKDALFYADEQIGKLVQFLKDRGLYEQSLMVVVGDHGEAFYEKGVCCHANELFYEQTRVQLVLKTSGQCLKGERREFAQVMDIVPTVLGLLGIRPHPGFAGDDIFSLKKKTIRPIFMTVQNPVINEDALVIRPWKMIKDYGKRQTWLFNLESDPQEEHNLISQYPKIAAALEDDIFFWRQSQFDYYADSYAQKEFYPPRIDKIRNAEGLYQEPK